MKNEHVTVLVALFACFAPLFPERNDVLFRFSFFIRPSFLLQKSGAHEHELMIVGFLGNFLLSFPFSAGVIQVLLQIRSDVFPALVLGTDLFKLLDNR